LGGVTRTGGQERNGKNVEVTQGITKKKTGTERKAAERYVAKGG